jgi:hypothetical protein
LAYSVHESLRATGVHEAHELKTNASATPQAVRRASSNVRVQLTGPIVGQGRERVQPWREFERSANLQR